MYMINILKRKIKYKKHILIIFMTLIYILSNPFSVYAKDKVNIYFFNGEGCSYCEKFKLWIDTIKPEYGNLFELKDYETWYNKENASLMYKVAELRGEEVDGVPYIVIGDHSWIGFHESYTQEIMTTIESEYKKNLSERYDVMNLVNSNSNNQKVDSSGSNINEETTIETSDDNGTTAALFIMLGIGIIVLAIALIPKYQKVKNDEKEKARFIKMVASGIGIFVVIFVVFLLFDSDSGSSSGGKDSDSSIINYVTRLVESNTSDVNRELGVYMLGSSGNVQRVNSANCSIKDNDNYGRYVLYCSIDYTGHTTGSGIDKSGNGSVYVGYLDTGDGKFNYKIGSTSSTNALSYLESKICWNSSSSSFVCN